MEGRRLRYWHQRVWAKSVLQQRRVPEPAGYLQVCLSQWLHGWDVENVHLFRHHHYHHQSLNRDGRWGTTDHFATSFLHFSLFSTDLWDLPNSRPVHSLMLSSHLFLCPPCLDKVFRHLPRAPRYEYTYVCVNGLNIEEVRKIQTCLRRPGHLPMLHITHIFECIR